MMASAVLVTVTVGGLAGCTRVPPPPSEFRAACGHPGASVFVTTVPVTVTHKSCDLRHVTIHYGAVSVPVPAKGSDSMYADTFTVTPGSSHLVVTVDPDTLDVTITGG